MSTPSLRSYQQAAVDSVFDYWTRGGPGSPIVELPTGSGKSMVLAELTRRLVQDYGARVLIATHRKELIDQDARAVWSLWPMAPVGIYSAGLSKKELNQVTVGGVQSLVVAARKADFPAFDVVLVDEAHLVAPDESTQYGTLLTELRKRNADLRLVGLTATPYRMSQGMLTSGAGAMFDTVTYQADVAELVKHGFLAPLVAPDHELTQIDTANIAVRGGEFVSKDMEAAADLAAVNNAVAQDVANALRAGRTSALVFSTSIKHAEHLADALRAREVNAVVVTGASSPLERQGALDAFKKRTLPCIVSCDVLTTGFDAPSTDVIALVRPTKSPGLYIQMVGRGMRIAQGKSDCLLLDYGGNVQRHGPVTRVTTPKEPTSRGKGEGVVKLCPSCFAEAPAGCRRCLHCDYEWPPPEVKVEQKASTLDPMGGKVEPPQTTPIGGVNARVHMSRNSGKNSVCFTFLSTEGLPVVSEYVCLEHEGFARTKAERWWRTFFDAPAPATCKEGVQEWRDGKMKTVKSVTTVMDGQYRRMKDADFAAAPPMREPGCDDDVDQYAQERAEAFARLKALDDVFQGDDIPF